MIRFSKFESSTDGAYGLAEYAPGFARLACSRFVDVDCDTWEEAEEEGRGVLTSLGYIVVGSLSVSREYQNDDESHHFQVCAECADAYTLPMWTRYENQLQKAYEEDCKWRNTMAQATRFTVTHS